MKNMNLQNGSGTKMVLNGGKAARVVDKSKRHPNYAGSRTSTHRNFNFMGYRKMGK